MAEGFLGGLLGGIGDAAQGVGSGLAGLLGGGQSGGPSSSGFTPDEERRMMISTLGQLGSTLLAAGQKQSPSQRAQYLAQLGGIGSGAQNDIYKARQGALMSAQMQAQMREMEQAKALDAWAKTPGNLEKVGSSLEQYNVIGPKGLSSIIQAQATRDPNQMALTKATLAGKQREVEQYNAAVSAIEGANLTPEQKAAALSNPGEWAKTQIKPQKMFLDEPVVDQAGKPVVDPVTGIPLTQQRNLLTGEVKRIGGSGVTVNLPSGEKGGGEIDVARIKDSQKAIKTMNATSSLLDVAQRQLLEGDLDTGILTSATLGIRKLAAGIGVLPEEAANKLAGEELFNSVTNAIVPKMREQGSGSTSNYEDQIFQQAAPQLAKTKEGNLLITSYLKQNMDYEKAYARAMDKYYRDNKGSLSGFDEFADKTIPKAIQTVSSLDQYKSLKKGAMYYSPEAKTFVIKREDD
jgi:hypothetical protein